MTYNMPEHIRAHMVEVSGMSIGEERVCSECGWEGYTEADIERVSSTTATLRWICGNGHDNEDELTPDGPDTIAEAEE